MKPVIEACVPKEDVLRGSIDDTVFAADLYAVFGGRAPEVYQDPKKFFDNTYPTEGLRSLFSEVFGRLSGRRPDSSPVIKLETSMGGGKTHSLIALYHAARSGRSLDLSQFVDGELIPEEDVRVAVLVGLEYGATGTGRSGEVSPMTMWGELAYQLGGEAAYRIVEEADRARQAPGAALIDKVLDQSGEPVLVLMDELAPHLVNLKGGKQAYGEQFTVFLQQLLAAASRRRRVVVVLSLTTERDPYPEETQEIVSAVEKVAAKFSHSISPSKENEIALVLKRRLFQSVDGAAAREAAAAYHAFYRDQDRKGEPLPKFVLDMGYKEHLEKFYPFHPELISVLDNKVSTIPDFQRTRGALRLLVRAIRRYYEGRRISGFIMPSDIDLSDEEVQMELTSKLNRDEFRAVIQSDIHSRMKAAKAQEIDRDGKTQAAKAVATVIFLHSLVEGQPGGIDKPTLYLATISPEIVGDRMDVSARFNRAILSPGLKPEDVNSALEALLDKCWYLYDQGNKYVFRTEANINKMISEEEEKVGIVEAKSWVETIVRQKFDGSLFKLYAFPESPADVPDNEDLKLVVVHWDSGTAKRNSPPPELVTRIFERAGQSEEFRIYRNTLIFLVADEQKKDEMIRRARLDLAIERILSNNDLMAQLSQSQRERLEERGKKAKLDLAVAVATAYSHIYYPPLGSDEEYEEPGRPPLDQLTLTVDESAVQRKGSQQENILEALVNSHKIVRDQDHRPSARYALERAWNPGEASLSTMELKRRFAKKPNLHILLNPDILKSTVRDGVENGLWVYWSKDGVYKRESAPVPIQISDDALLFLPEEAERRNITARKEEEEIEEIHEAYGKRFEERLQQQAASAVGELEASGDVERAFNQLLGLLKERGVRRVKAIKFSVSDAKGLRGLGLLVPQLGKATTTVNLSCELRDDSGELTIAFRGSWDDYKEIKDFLEGAAGTAGGKRLRLESIDADFEVEFGEGLEASEAELARMKESLLKYQVDRVKLSATPGD